MKTDFFWKNMIRCIGFLIGIVFFGVLLIKNQTANQTTIEIQKEFYFLASTSTHIEASTHTAQQLGGAGFSLEYKDRTYVTYAVYTDENKAKQAYQSLKLQEKDACVLTVGITKSARISKEYAIVYKNALDCLYAQIRLFNAEIARLEDGATQESTKRFLKIQQRQFSYMEKEYEKSFPNFSVVCKQAVAQIEDMKNEIVYVKDLRYLECFLCQEYFYLGNNLTAYK